MNAYLKKAFVLLLTAGMLFSCAGDDGIPDSGETVKIVATNFALYDFARLYESDLIEVEMLVAPGAESHDFEATIGDIAKVSEADIFVCAGGDSDAWVKDLLESLGSAGEKMVVVNAVEVICGGETADSAHEAGDEHEHLHTDDHVWTSIPNAMTLIREIGEAVKKVDETKSGEVGTSAERRGAYLAELGALDQDFRDVIASGERTEIAVADRFPFVCMAEEYGLTWSAAFDGCSSNVEVPLAVINGMINEVKEKQLPAVFYIEFSDRTAVDTVCGETGAEALLLHSCHNVTAEEFRDGVTYLDLMRQNLGALRIALN